MASPEDSPAKTPGERVYLIRRALGPNVRSELSLRAFADVVNAKAEELGLEPVFDASTLSKIERGARRLGLEEVPVFAALDPQRRGRAWIAWGIDTADLVREAASARTDMSDADYLASIPKSVPLPVSLPDEEPHHERRRPPRRSGGKAG